MNRAMSAVVCAALVSGCGSTYGDDTTRMPLPGRPYELGEVYPRTDSFEWEGQTVTFREVVGDDGQTAGAMVTQLVPVGAIDLYSQVVAEDGSVPTPAELFRFVSGVEALPDYLVIDHEQMAARYNRTDQMMDVRLLPEEFDLSSDLINKAVAESVVLSSFFPRTTGACWSGATTQRFANNNASMGLQKYICTGANSDDSTPLQPVRNGSVTPGLSCPFAATAEVGFLRAAVFNDGVFGSSFSTVGTATACQGIGNFAVNGSWSCTAPVSLPLTFFVTHDFDSGLVHRVGMGISNPAGAAGQYFYWMGEGKRVFGTPPRPAPSSFCP